MKTYTNKHADNRQLIVISAPSDKYYKDVYQQIITFNIAYAKSILGKDNVVVLGDKKALKLLEKELPKDILLEATMRDIWMRDFTTVNPNKPIQFRYAASSQGGSQRDADWVQKGFVKFTDKLGIRYKYTDLILDGGNLVDNHQDKAIVTERFLEDNKLTKANAKKELKKLLDVSKVAIIPADDVDGLAHADGMAMFIDENTVVVNRYNEPFRSQVIKELKFAFPGIKIIEIAVNFDEEVWDERFSSACGINANSLVTNNFIYMPVFNTDLDNRVVKTIQRNTTKQVVPINAENVCFMGGSVRCLGWQIAGEPARKIIEAARVK
ncbi:MAG: agmatine deiminase family protein [Nostocaceae cyanobacterium]|nr:agmatine deiminase family protein [Nostocaceae cyanobacterium]